MSAAGARARAARGRDGLGVRSATPLFHIGLSLMGLGMLNDAHSRGVRALALARAPARARARVRT